MTAPWRTARVVWAALVVSLALYLVVLASVVGTPAPGEPAPPSGLRHLFMLLALGNIGGVWVLRQRLPLVEPPPSAVSDPRTVLGIYVACWALSEAVALYGLVVGVVARSFGEAQPFFIVGTGLLLWQRPRARHFGA